MFLFKKKFTTLLWELKIKIVMSCIPYSWGTLYYVWKSEVYRRNRNFVLTRFLGLSIRFQHPLTIFTGSRRRFARMRPDKVSCKIIASKRTARNTILAQTRERCLLWHPLDIGTQKLQHRLALSWKLWSPKAKITEALHYCNYNSGFRVWLEFPSWHSGKMDFQRMLCASLRSARSVLYFFFFRGDPPLEVKTAMQK